MEITTNTIAELYIKQGYPEKAVDIYRAILELDPGNATAKEKLDKLEAEIRGESAAVQAGKTESVLEPPPVLSAESGEAAPVANDVDAQIVKLEGWLASISQAGRRA